MASIVTCIAIAARVVERMAPRLGLPGVNPVMITSTGSDAARTRFPTETAIPARPSPAAPSHSLREVTWFSFNGGRLFGEWY